MGKAGLGEISLCEVEVSEGMEFASLRLVQWSESRVMTDSDRHREEFLVEVKKDSKRAC